MKIGELMVFNQVWAQKVIRKKAKVMNSQPWNSRQSPRNPERVTCFLILKRKITVQECGCNVP
jgi:hypothetical protein